MEAFIFLAYGIWRKMPSSDDIYRGKLRTRDAKSTAPSRRTNPVEKASVNKCPDVNNRSATATHWCVLSTTNLRNIDPHRLAEQSTDWMGELYAGICLHFILNYDIDTNVTKYQCFSSSYKEARRIDAGCHVLQDYFPIFIDGYFAAEYHCLVPNVAVESNEMYWQHVWHQSDIICCWPVLMDAWSARRLKCSAVRGYRIE